jgi:hypothetical protein
LKDRNGNSLAVDYTDKAVFTVASAFILGDINGDGVVDVPGDFTLAMKIAVGQRAPDADELRAGDIDGDGKITKTDATLIKRIVHGLAINPGGASQGEGGGSLGGSEPLIGGYQLSLGTFEIQKDSLVRIPVQIDNAKDIACLDLRINFDDDVLVVQGVTNAPLTSCFDLEYLAGAGYVDIVMSSSNQLVDGSGTILYLDCYVRPDVEVGDWSDVSISRRGLGNQYGADLGWSYGISASNGSVNLVSLSIRELARQGGMTNGFRMKWPTAMDKRYTVEYSTNLLDGFHDLETDIDGTGFDKEFVDTNTVNSVLKYYRIRAE